MFNRIRVEAADTVIDLLKQGFFFDIPAELNVRSFADEATASTDWIFDETLMDADGDGRITIQEVRSYDDPNMDSALKGSLREFIDYVAQEMKLTDISDGTSNTIFVRAAELEAARGEQPPLFSYDGLCTLTTTMFASDGLAVSLLLCEKLEAAEAAEASGDLPGRDKAIKSYKKLLKSEIGRTITRSNANMLTGMLDILISQ
jgi:hypothetical protein